jgi:hypothetical protein
MPSSASEDVTRTYAERQTRILALIDQIYDFIGEIYRANPDDKYILFYPRTVSVRDCLLDEIV